MQLTKTLTQVPVNLDWEAPSAAVKMTGPYTLDTPKKSYICEPARAQR